MHDRSARRRSNGYNPFAARPILGGLHHQYKRMRLTAIAHDIAPGPVGAYYPEASNLCPLDDQDKESGTPSYKSLPICIRKVI
jgi:hypothetical protein